MTTGATGRAEPVQITYGRILQIFFWVVRELHMPEVEKFIAGLEAGVFEAYETLGMALGIIVDQPNQSDIFMAIIFGLMPESAQRTMLADLRVQESRTVLPLLQQILAARDGKRH